MAEYIKREELMEFPIRRNHYDRKNGNKHFINGIETVLEYAENLPAADVAPVRHGRWIDKGEYAVCTECGGRSGTQYDSVEPIPLMTQFCQNCGAKMDGETGGK